MSAKVVSDKRELEDQRPDDDRDGVRLSPEERRRQRARNIAIGVVLAGLFVLFYVLTIARLGSNVFDRPL